MSKKLRTVWHTRKLMQDAYLRQYFIVTALQRHPFTFKFLDRSATLDRQGRYT